MVTAAALLAAVATLYLWLKERTREPREAAAAAVEAVTTARRAAAGTWAPAELENAESTLRASLAERRAQAVRLFFLRDYRRARTGFLLAQGQAYEATAIAQQTSSQVEQEAAAALQRAARAVETATRVSRDIPLDRAGRQHLRKSQSALAEADFHLERGDPQKALESANQAIRDAEAAVGRATNLAGRFVDEEQIQIWRRWIDETIATSRRTGGPALVVVKEKHTLTLYSAGEPVHSYPAELGQNNLRDKMSAGDRATPEGRYFITVKKGPGRSRYHRALELDYPNESDLRRFRRARRAGQVSGAVGPGRLIEIHGEGGRGWDWTDGCIALSNHDMDDLFARVGPGTPVTIVGGDGGGGVFSDAIRSAGERAMVP